MISTIPKDLHRYFSYERGYQALQTGSLYYAPIHKYNDPFELVPAASSDLFKISTDEFLQKMIEIAETEEGKKKIQEIEETLGVDDFILGASLAAEALMFPILTAIIGTGLFLMALGDETDKIKILACKFYPLLRKARCCSFSDVYDNNLMWSHYTGGHKGMVLTFDSFVGNWPKGSFRMMEYSNERIGLPSPNSDPNEYIWNMLTRKSLDWSYEHECRLILLNPELTLQGDDGISIPFRRKALKSIRLGVNIGENQRNDILRLRDKQYKDTIVYQARFNKREYKLDFEQL